MDTKQAVGNTQGAARNEADPQIPIRQELKSERVQDPQAAVAGLQIRVQAERIQKERIQKMPVASEEDAIYIYEFSVSQRQPVTIDLPLILVTFHGDPAWSVPGGQTDAVPAAARRLG